ncbi:MAG TPA: FAD-NAD(P)-binding protein, partial [Paenirhodobacter sp.]
LSEVDRDRFDAGLKKVFVDNYAAVPPESIRRLLALRYAGILRILALGVNYDLHRKTDRTMIRIPQAKETAAEHVFDVFIDARGQKPLMSEDLPFPALCKTLLAAGQDIPEVDAGYKLTIPETAASRIYLGALPYLMHDHPFVQGITACAEIGDAMAGDICRSAAQGDTRKRRYWL